MKKVYPLRLEESMITQVQQMALENDRSANAEFRRLVTKGLSSDMYLNMQPILKSKLELIASKNGMDTQNPQDIIKVLMHIADTCITFLDEESFHEITTLNK